MAENTIEIEIELVGQDETLKGLDKVKEGAEGIGESFKGVGDLVGKTNEELGEGLSSVSDAVGESIGAFEGMAGAIKDVAVGGAGITALIGPIGALIGALALGYEAFMKLSGLEEELANRKEAMAAAAADLESKLEALAEGGVVLAGKELEKLMNNVLDSQVAKEQLQKRIEKLNKVYFKNRDLTAEVAKQQQLYNKGIKDSSDAFQSAVDAANAKARAEKALKETTKQLAAEMDKLRQVQEQVSLQLAEAAKLEKAAEENTYDNVKAKALEYAERKKALDIMQAEMGVRDEEIIQLQKLQAVVERRAVQRKIDQADDATDLKTLKEIRDQLKRQVEAIEDETKAKHESHQMDEVIRKSREKRITQMKAERAQRLAQAKAEEALAQQRLAQESQLRQLQIQYTLEGDAQLLALARERYDTGLQLAKDDATKRAIVETQYRLEVRKIQEAELDRDVAALDARLAKEKEAAQALRDFRFETAEFNASMIRDEGERELALLQVKYDKELALAEDNQMKRTELQRRYGLERARLEQQSAAKMQEVAEKLIDDYGKGFAQASVGALMFGENFEESIAKVTKSLAMEAGVQALMELAKGTAALLLNPVQASTHFKSAALFGSAALLAKGASSALGGGGGGGATGTASPSGSALSAPAPQRQSAEQESMVFNINFGGAVIYDTRRAAEEALADRVATVFNRPRRGAVRPVMMRG
jgi:hypothetical protein